MPPPRLLGLNQSIDREDQLNESSLVVDNKKRILQTSLHRSLTPDEEGPPPSPPLGVPPCGKETTISGLFYSKLLLFGFHRRSSTYYKYIHLYLLLFYKTGLLYLHLLWRMHPRRLREFLSESEGYVGYRRWVY